MTHFNSLSLDLGKTFSNAYCQDQFEFSSFMNSYPRLSAQGCDFFDMKEDYDHEIENSVPILSPLHCWQKLQSYNNNEPSIDQGTTQLSPKFNSYNQAVDLDFTSSLSQPNIVESI